MTETILLITQNKLARNYHETLGRMPQLLRERGYRVEWACPREGDALPERLDHLAGVCIDGAPFSANDGEAIDWIRVQMRFIERCLGEGIPLLTMCMAAGLLARVLGARIARHPSGLGERGYRPIIPTEAGRSLFPEPFHAYFWHQDGFSVPEGAVLLAASPMFNQAFVHGGTAYGLQFHPEWTPEIFRRWSLSMDPVLWSFPGADDPGRQQEDGKRYDPAVERWLTTFLDGWLRLRRPGRPQLPPAESGFS